MKCQSGIAHPIQNVACQMFTEDYLNLSMSCVVCHLAGDLDGKSQEAVVFIKSNSDWLEKHMNKMIGHLSNE